uniref:Endonuclease/exonuclease/phosphatase domain-containing protein n=1 Tax=Oryza punctata TaxID=4537 RepID=A0A0E0L225_ORYPU
MLKLQTTWAASLPLFRLRPCPGSPPTCGRRLPFVPICKRRMSTQAQPSFAPLPAAQSESDAGAAGYQFRLVSYNILAQVYVKSAFFPHSPSACLKWKARSKAVLSELKSFEADLMCVQELDEYDTFYKKNMENSGYSSIYIQRSGDKRDGCGIFYKPKSMELVQKEGIHYNDLVEKYVHGDHVNSGTSNNSSPTEEASKKADNNKHGDPNDPRFRLKRDCVGLLAAFKLNDPFMIAGDFNSTPGDKVYNYLVSSNSDSTDEAPIKLRSLYAANGGEPEFTNCTPGFTGTLDYIFLSDGSSVKPTSLLRIPRGDSADVQGGLPNFHHPSDHLPIGADFQLDLKFLMVVKGSDSQTRWRMDFASYYILLATFIDSG